MDSTTLLLVLVPLLVFVVLALGLFALMTRQAGAVPGGMGREPAAFGEEAGERAGEWERPWWGNPWVWVAVAAVFLVLGLVVAPQLFGGVFVILPFIWIGGRRRRRRPPRGT